MIPRTITEADLVRLKQEREEADRRYNEALTHLDAAVQAPPDLPHPPPPPDEIQITPLNERWEILTAASPLPGGLRGRVARFVWGLVEPLFTKQQAFNAALVEHVNRNAAPARAVPASIQSTIELVRQQTELAIRFQSRLILFAQQVTPFVDTKDYEFSGLATRVGEDAAEAAARTSHRLGELVSSELPYLQRMDDLRGEQIKGLDRTARGIAGAMSGLSDEMLKRFESATARDARNDARLNELAGTLVTLQQLTHSLRRDLARRNDAAATTTAPDTAAADAARGVRRHPSTPARGADLPTTSSTQQLLASDPIHSSQYVGFEDLYRGSEAEIRTRMLDYAQMFDGASDVLDVGCGRGEFLTLLGERGVRARGIDLNHDMVARCQERGLDVTEADALSYLRGLPDESLGGLIATQVVEHLPPDYLLQFLTTAFDKLRPGARLILETINPASWAAFFDSYIRDLTHQRPVHPDTLKYLVTASGFTETTIAWRSPYAADSKLQPAPQADEATTALVDAFNHNVERLNGMLFTYMDYAVIARRP